MQVKVNYTLLFPLMITVISLLSCNPKPKDEVTDEPTKTVIDCELWKNNQTFISATYAEFKNRDEKTYVNKLSMLQLINALEVESFPKLQERKVKLLEKLNNTSTEANNEIEFPQDAILLRDQLSLMIQNYIDTCNMVR